MKRAALLRARVRKLCLVLLLVLAASWVLLQLYDWDTSVNYYRAVTECTEEVYNFAVPPSGVSFSDDAALKQSCTAAESERRRVFTLNGHNTHNLIKDKCNRTIEPKLLSFISKDNSSQELNDLPVPNIVHYVSLGDWQFSFLNYLSFVSVSRYIRPRAVYIHGDGLPHGEWFTRMLAEVPHVYHVPRQRPIRILGRAVTWLEHSSDVMRLQTLYDNGGIYVDTDVLAVRSFTPLRRHATTLGRETSYGLGSGIIVSAPRSAFLCGWLHAYRAYRPVPWHWAADAVWDPHTLARAWPHTIHIEPTSLQHPCWWQAEKLFDEVYPWQNSADRSDPSPLTSPGSPPTHSQIIKRQERALHNRDVTANTVDLSPLTPGLSTNRESVSRHRGNYAIHVWKRHGHVPARPADIDALNTTLGQVMRHVYYGSAKLRLVGGGGSGSRGSKSGSGNARVEGGGGGGGGLVVNDENGGGGGGDDGRGVDRSGRFGSTWSLGNLVDLWGHHLLELVGFNN